MGHLEHPLTPTYRGYIGSTEDAIIIMQAVLNGTYHSVTRRLTSEERIKAIVLGNVFVFIEESSNIKRWTDGKAWSASRILGRFLMYRELDRKKSDLKASLGKCKNRSISIPLHPYGPCKEDELQAPDASEHVLKRPRILTKSEKDAQSSMKKVRLGTEVMDYRSGYIPCPANLDGQLIKKTISFTIEGKENEPAKTIHLISYFAPKDIDGFTLLRPSATSLCGTTISHELLEAVEKSTINMRPAPSTLESYFLDSKYQLSKLPALKHKDPSTRSFDKSHEQTKEDKRTPTTIEDTNRKINYQKFDSSKLAMTYASSKPVLLFTDSFEAPNAMGTQDSDYRSSAQNIPSRPGLPLSHVPSASISYSAADDQVTKENGANKIILLSSQIHPQMMLPIPVPIPNQMPVNGQRLGNTVPCSLVEQVSAQNTRLLNPYQGLNIPSNQSMFPNPYVGGFAPDFQQVAPLLQRRYFPEFHMASVHSASVPFNGYALGYDQQYSVGYYPNGHDQQELHPDARHDLRLLVNRKMASPLGFDDTTMVFPRPRSEDVDTSQQFEESFR